MKVLFSVSLRVIFLFSMLLLAGSCSKTSELSIDTPQKIKTYIEQSQASVILVHVWATWCVPCREEFPDLLRACREFDKSKFELLLISANDPSEQNKVKQFLLEHKTSAKCIITSELSQGFMETLSPQWNGSLPSSFFYVNGKLAAQWEGKRSQEQYVKMIDELLKK